MRTLQTWILLFVVTVITVDCAAVGPSLVPVTNPTQRIEFQGFSILPPQGENWFMAPPELRKQQGVIVSFLKLATPPSITHTVAATVSGGRVSLSAGSRAELLQKMAQRYSEQTNRNRPVSVNISPDKTLAPDCVRYDVTAEDRGVPGYPSSVYISDVHGYICLHPELPDAVIDIGYSQRRLQEEPPLSLEAEGEPFLKSLLFTSNFSLIERATAGDTSTMQALLAKGTDVNARDKKGGTALMHAAGRGHETAVQVLLDKGADVNANDTASFTALMAVSTGGNTNIAHTLIAKGADVNAKTKDGSTPLMYAAGSGHLGIVQALLAEGADVNASGKMSGGRVGWTALMDASTGGYTDIVQALLAKGADVNAKMNNGVTALMQAVVGGGHTDTVQALLKKGATVNARDEAGTTSLIYAAFYGHVGSAQALLAAGADVNARNNEGKTALAVAQQRGYGKIVQLLKDAGAKE